jgi:hypothetical protein
MDLWTGIGILLAIVALVAPVTPGFQNPWLVAAVWLGVAIYGFFLISSNLAKLAAATAAQPKVATVIVGAYAFLAAAGLFHTFVAQKATSPGKPPAIPYNLHFAMLMDPSPSPGDDPLQLDFRLSNFTTPPDEVHNIFGTLWIDGEFVIAASLLPVRGKAGAVGHLEWDIQVPVFPKGGTFVAPSIRLRRPPSGKEIVVGAQFVSKETDTQEYLWKIVNYGGQIRRATLKNGNINEK